MQLLMKLFVELRMVFEVVVEINIHLKVIRIGAQDSMHEQVRDVSIEHLVERD